MNDVVVLYNGEQVSVPKEGAEFLEQDRKRALDKDKQDKRHLSKSSFETVLFCYTPARGTTEDDTIRNLQLENLRRIVIGLDRREQELISLRYQQELTMEEIGKAYGISKMAVSKRLKTLRQKLRGSVS